MKRCGISTRQDVVLPRDRVVAFPRDMVVFTKPKNWENSIQLHKLFVTASSEQFAARVDLGSTKQYIIKMTDRPITR